jgi:hypothetical protein
LKAARAAGTRDAQRALSHERSALEEAVRALALSREQLARDQQDINAAWGRLGKTDRPPSEALLEAYVWKERGWHAVTLTDSRGNRERRRVDSTAARLSAEAQTLQKAQAELAADKLALEARRSDFEQWQCQEEARLLARSEYVVWWSRSWR